MPNMTELQDVSRKLAKLMEDPQPGLFTWHMLLHEQLLRLIPQDHTVIKTELLIKVIWELPIEQFRALWPEITADEHIAQRIGKTFSEKVEQHAIRRSETVS